MTGHGGWPLNVFLTPEQAAVLRRHLLPARAAPRDARLDAGAAGGRRGVARARREEIRAGGERLRERPRRRAPARAAPRSRSTSARSSAAVRAAARRPSTRATAASAARRSSRQASVLEFLLLRGEREMSLRDAARDGGGGIHDQVGGGFARYASTRPGRCPTSRRCSTTTRCSRAPTCTAGRRPARRLLERLPRDARVGAARDARPRGRLLLGAGRRLRGRRGALLRVDASPS